LQGSGANITSPAWIDSFLLYRVRKPAMARKNLQVSEIPGNAAGSRPRNILIYIRVSTEKQSSNQLSLDSQEKI
jgi:hypothetical protein